MAKSVLEKLKGDDLRKLGRADEVVQDILQNPDSFGEVFQGIFTDDPVIRMRSSDVIEKVSREHPEYLQPYKNKLIKEMATSEQQEVRWNMAQMVSYLKLSKEEVVKVINILLNWINIEKSKIVLVNSLQALANLVKQDESIRSKVIDIIKNTIEGNSAVVVNRGKKFLKESDNS